MMMDAYINVCEDLLTSGKTEDAEHAAQAMERGYLARRENGEMFVPIPAFTREQQAQLNELAESHFVPLMQDYGTTVRAFAEGYFQMFPKHLREDAQRLSRGSFGAFFDYICRSGMQQGTLPPIPENAVCQVLVQHP